MRHNQLATVGLVICVVGALLALPSTQTIFYNYVMAQGLPIEGFARTNNFLPILGALFGGCLVGFGAFQMATNILPENVPAEMFRRQANQVGLGAIACIGLTIMSWYLLKYFLGQMAATSSAGSYELYKGFANGTGLFIGPFVVIGLFCAFLDLRQRYQDRLGNA